MAIIVPVTDSRDVTIDLKDSAGVRQTLSGATAITFTVYSGKNRARTVLQKTAAAGGIVVDVSNLFATVKIDRDDLTVRGTYWAVASYEWSPKTRYSVGDNLIVE